MATDSRKLRNEVVFRDANERIEDLNEAFGVLAETMTVICECGRLECTEQVPLDIPTYERVRSDSTHFVVLPGHELPGFETIVERHDGFNIISKDPGGPAEVARETDERR